jgi:hypothetical protein
MLHQDQGSRTSTSKKAFNSQDLREVIGWLLLPSLFAGIRFRKDSRFKPITLAAAALCWAWSDELTLQQRFFAAGKIIRSVFPGQPELPNSYQAFVKMLRRWGTSLLLVVVGHFQFRMRSELSEHFQVAGYVVFGVDGSRVELPRTEDNEAEFAGSGKQGKGRAKGKGKRGGGRKGRKGVDKKSTSPQIWLTTLWHVGTGLPWDWRRGASGSSEREHLLEMLGSLPENSLVAADAGFVGYECWAALLEAGHDFVIRVGANVKLLKRLGYAREYDNRVYLWPDKAASNEKPPLVLRLVVVHNGKHPVYLVTSVLSGKQLCDRQVAEIYNKRWGIEVFYRSFKQTFGRRKLRSRAAKNAEVELDWSLAGLWAVCLFAKKHHAERGIPPSRLSIAGALRAIRRPMREYKSRPDPGEDLGTLLAEAVLDGYPRKSKRSRDYPKKKREKPTGKPTIANATKAQIQQAQELKQSEPQLRLTA